MYFTGIAANHIKESSVKNHELAVKLTDAHVYRRLGSGALDMSAFDISMSTDGCHLYSPRELAQHAILTVASSLPPLCCASMVENPASRRSSRFSHFPSTSKAPVYLPARSIENPRL